MNKSILLTLLAFAITLTGCSTVDKKHVAEDGVAYKEAKHGIKVWRTDTIDLAKYKTLVVHRPTSQVPPEKEEKERQQFDRILTQLHNGLSSEILARSLVSSASLAKTNAPAATPSNEASATSLIVETEIVEYHRGNPALRHTVGTSGAGTPRILIKGLLRDGATSQPILRFAASRDFEPRAFEFGDETILMNHMRDLSSDCAEVIVTTLKPQAAGRKP